MRDVLIPGKSKTTFEYMQTTALCAVQALGQQWCPSWSTCSTSAERSLKDTWKHSSGSVTETALPLFPVARSNLKTDRSSSQLRTLLIKNLQLLPKKNSHFLSSISSALQHRHNQGKAQNTAPGMERLAVMSFDFEKAHREKKIAGSPFLQTLL